jgi:hypothetical protein
VTHYAILNNRKRTIIALVHTVAFGLLALWQYTSNWRPTALIVAKSPHLAGPIALTAIYLVVTVVLFALLRYSASTLERLYFAFLSISAGIGLVRVAVGDPTLRFGGLLRVLLLGSATLIGFLILKQQSSTQAQFAD